MTIPILRRSANVALSAFVCCACSAQAQTFYGITDTGAFTLFDMGEQSVSVIGSMTSGPAGLIGFEDLEFDASGNLYAMQAQVFSGFPPAPANNKTYLINPDAATALQTGSFGTSGKVFPNLAFRPSNDSFYAVRNSGGLLGVVGVTTGTFAPVSGSSVGFRNYVEALAVNPVTGAAYSIVDGGSPPPFGSSNFSLMSTDLDAGVSSFIGSLGQGTNAFKALRFDSDGVAYTVNYQTGDVFTVNLSTGAATFLFAGGTAARNTTGLAFIVPAPASFTIGMGLLGLGAVRRRR